MSPQNYKYCIVPKCSSSTCKTPEKLFINVPRDPILRKKWCIAIKRDEGKNKQLSFKTVRFVCGDHFDLENDMENYMQHKLQGGKIFLKQGVLPHIFQCQKQPIKPPPSRERGEKRNIRQLVAELLNSVPSTSSSFTPDTTDPTDDLDSHSENVASVPPDMMKVDKAVQVKIKVRSKATNTPRSVVKNISCSPLIFPSVAHGTSPMNGTITSDVDSYYETSDSEYILP